MPMQANNSVPANLVDEDHAMESSFIEVMDILEAVDRICDRMERKYFNKELETMRYVDYVYEIIKREFDGMDAIYQDYITHFIGSEGLKALKEAELIESCGVVNGRKLCVLCDKKGE